MPGLFGIWLKRDGRIDPASLWAMGRHMADAMRTTPWLRADLWGTDSFCGGRVHLGVLNPSPQPLMSGDKTTYAWFDGHYFANSAVSEHATPTAEEIVALSDNPAALADRVDGVFNLACFSARTKELVLGNDRLGFRPLYYTETPDWFAYAGEVKALLSLFDRLPELDEIALRQFLSLHRMLDQRTWWQGISLMPPASLWRLSPAGVSRRRYWSFADLPVREVAIPDAHDEFGRLWTLEVRRHSRAGTMPILLSGGLDSRLLFAELLAQGADVLPVTFGSLQSPELGRARQVTKIAGVAHQRCLLDTHNWWDRREEGISHTDGLVNASHLNCAITMSAMHSGSCYSAVNIAGDLLFGGSRLESCVVPSEWGREPAAYWLRRSYKRNPFVSREEFVEYSLPEAINLAHAAQPECIHLQTEYRRYILYFPLSLTPHCEFGFPGLGKETLALFLGGIPESARRGSKFYNDFLVRRYPKFYLNIPWERTGRGLAETRWVKAWRDAGSHTRRTLLYLGRKVGRRVPPDMKSRARNWLTESDAERVPLSRWFVDFHRCVAESRVRERLLQEPLLLDDALKGAVRRVLSDNDPQVVTPPLLIAVLTAETYLRQVSGMPWPNRMLTSADNTDKYDRVLRTASEVLCANTQASQ